jgi:seryl-tRNA(Sec) selenium transferase
MATKNATEEMEKLKKQTKLEPGEKVINMYSTVEMESLGNGCYHPKGTKFKVHPEHVKHLEEKKFAKKVIGSEKTEIPEVDKAREAEYIKV